MDDLSTTFGRRADACRFCGSGRLHAYLDLGQMAPADQFLRADQLEPPSARFPLEVVLCEDCGLSQLSFVVSPEILYQQDYPYESSMTRAGQLHFDGFAASVTERFGFGEGDLAVDIGSNVGVLLRGFAERGLTVLGVDPAANIAAIAVERGIETLPELFDEKAAARIASQRGLASVITATNVFAHVDDLDAFVRAVDALLADDGVFVIEAPWFANLLLRLEYDTIYHEHLSYLTIGPLKRFFSERGFRLFDVQEVDIHGGSIRIFVDRGGHDVEDAVLRELMLAEEEAGSFDREKLIAFAGRVEANRAELQELLHDLRREGKTIVGVSAPAKGMTLLNYCGFGSETLDYVTEKSRLKIGRFTPGTHLRVVGDEELLATRPDYALLLAWNFADEIMANLSEYRDAGGRFIIPIPSPRIVAPTEVLQT